MQQKIINIKNIVSLITKCCVDRGKETVAHDRLQLHKRIYRISAGQNSLDMIASPVKLAALV
jgi:hypothetical protein